jgi:DNA-binding beta-propeller fold protein YncE
MPVARRDRPGRIGAAFSLAAAAVLVLALAGGLVAIRFDLPSSDDGHFGGIQAEQVSPVKPPAGPVEFLWQTRGDPESPLGLPAHLAVAPDGAIWVADGDNNRFQIFAPDGSLREVWGEPGSGDGQFEFTADGLYGYDQGAVAFAPDGSFYVADPGNHRIQKFGPDRSFLLAWGSIGQEPGQFATPVDLVVDRQGRVYVVDRFRNGISAGSAVGAVQVFDADGRFLFQWGERGTEPGLLSAPFAIELDADGTLLVADFANSRVQRFTPEGEPRQLIGGSGTEDGRFMSTMGAAADGQGRIYVTDYRNFRVQVFDREGRFLAAWGKSGAGAGEFAGPLGVAVGPDGTVYITDESKRLQAFRIGDLPEPAATPAS